MLRNRSNVFLFTAISLFTILFSFEKSHGYEDPIFEAIRAGDLDKVIECISNGSKLDAREEKTSYTPLHRAATKGYLPIVKYLVEQGANLEDEFVSGRPITAAALGGHLNVVKYLVSVGAQIEPSTPESSPLLWSLHRRHYDIAQFLLDKGVSPNAMVSRSSGTALEFFASLGFYEQVKFLLENGASPDASNYVDNAYSPLGWAVANLKKKIFELLIKYRTYIPKEKLFNSLNMAIYWNLEGTVEILLNDYKIDPNERLTDDSLYPILYAAREGHKPIFELLLKSGANLQNNYDKVFHIQLQETFFLARPEPVQWILDEISYNEINLKTVSFAAKDAVDRGQIQRANLLLDFLERAQ